jgi:hypothetical protein
MPDFSTDTTGLQPIDSREFVASADRETPQGPSKFAQALDFLIPMTQTGFSSGLIKAPQVLNVAMSAAFSGGQTGQYGGGMASGPAMFGGSSAGKFMTGGTAGKSQTLGIPGPQSPQQAGVLGGGGGVGGGAGMGGMGNPAAGASGMGGPDQYGGQIDAMFNNNMMFMMLQTKVQNMSQQFQAVSNIYKADHDARTNAIRNFRS